MIFKLLQITWQTFSTIGTFLAVVVAIFLPSWRDRRRLRLRPRIGQVIWFGTPPAEHLITLDDPNSPSRDPTLPMLVTVTVTNAGRNPIVIDGWEMRFANQPEGSRSLFVKPERAAVPVELAHGKGAQFISSDRSIFKNMSGLAAVWVTDTLGKNWYVSGSEIRKIRAWAP